MTAPRSSSWWRPPTWPCTSRSGAARTASWATRRAPSGSPRPSTSRWLMNAEPLMPAGWDLPPTSAPAVTRHPGARPPEAPRRRSLDRTSPSSDPARPPSRRSRLSSRSSPARRARPAQGRRLGRLRQPATRRPVRPVGPPPARPLRQARPGPVRHRSPPRVRPTTPWLTRVDDTHPTPLPPATQAPTHAARRTLPASGQRPTCAPSEARPRSASGQPGESRGSAERPWIALPIEPWEPPERPKG